MATSVPDLASLAARVETLEKQNRTWKWVALAALALALAVGVVAIGTIVRRGLLPRVQEHSTFKTVDAEAFVLRDKDGLLRMRATVEDPDGPVVKVYDDNGLVVRLYEKTGSKPVRDEVVPLKKD